MSKRDRACKTVVIMLLVAGCAAAELTPRQQRVHEAFEACGRATGSPSR